MDMQKMRHEINVTKWQGIVLECRRSGKTARDWCKEQGIKVGTYYRWQRLCWDEGINKIVLPETAAPTFIECGQTVQESLPTEATAIVLHLSCGKVEIQQGADRETIENTLSVLQKLC